jgi:hypothetical protein
MIITVVTEDFPLGCVVLTDETIPPLRNGSLLVPENKKIYNENKINTNKYITMV